MEFACLTAMMLKIGHFLLALYSGPRSSVGIATDYCGARFSAVQIGPGSHPASCTMDTGSFLGVKYARRVLLTTHPLLVPWSWKSRAIPVIPVPTLWATTEPVRGTHFFYCLHIRSILSVFPWFWLDTFLASLPPLSPPNHISIHRNIIH